MFRRFVLVMALCLICPFTANAQDALSTIGNPPMPKPLREQQSAGAQVYYVGRFEGLDGWVMVRESQPEFYYATLDGKALVMGFLFDADGNLLTGEQLKKLTAAQKAGLDSIVKADPATTIPPAASAVTPPADSVFAQPTQSGPAALLYSDVQSAAGLTLGQAGLPTFYAFIDPNCPHCQQFLKDIEPHVNAGKLALRIIPVGFSADSLKQASSALASVDGAQRFMNYAKGDTTAMPGPEGINTEAVTRNTGLMQSWNLTATPTILYRTPKGDVKIIRGNPRKMDAVIADLKGQP